MHGGSGLRLVWLGRWPPENVVEKLLVYPNVANRNEVSVAYRCLAKTRRNPNPAGIQGISEKVPAKMR